MFLSLLCEFFILGVLFYSININLMLFIFPLFTKYVIKPIFLALKNVKNQIIGL